MKKLLLLSLLSVSCVFFAQQYNGKVGINTTTPTENLDVNGNVYADLLYLRTPGEPQELPIFFMASEGEGLDVYDPSLEGSSLVNLLNLTFNNTNNTGVTAYNTKIDANNFIAAVRTFSIENYGGNSADRLKVYNVHNNNTTTNQNAYYQGSPDFVAYVAPTDPADSSSPKTWWVRARYLDSRFSASNGEVSNTARYTIKLQLLVYKKLITKYVEQSQNINLNGTNGSTSGYTIPKPNGF
ncbi:MAG: hypothetical protein Q4G16_02985 [Cruoricaptor ignavus]|nr:hypothetical protein [Cruoricaptor ignavus]